MTIWRWLVTDLLVLLFLVACTDVPDSTPPPEQNIVKVETPVIELPSITPSPTLIATPKLVVTDEIPEATVSPTPTSIPVTSPTWSPKIDLLHLVDSSNIVWSPLHNEFLYDTCSESNYGQATLGNIILASINGQQPVTIAQDFICPEFGIFNISWTPDGQQILFTGSPLDTSTPTESGGIFITDITGGDIKVLLTDEQVGTKLAPDFRFWLDEDTFLYSGYITGGRELNALVNTQTGTHSYALAISHAEDINDFYLVGNDGINTTSYTSAIAIPLEEMWSTNFDSDTSFFDFIERTHLSPSTFSSAFMDWLPDTNQMLVLTWDKDLDLFENTPVTTQLQIWDITANTLTMLIPKGRYGNFSPDGSYLAYLIRSENSSDIQLLNRIDNSVIFTMPEYADEDNEFVVNPRFSFSPDGRFLTFYTHHADSPENSFLNVFDVSRQQVITELPATPFWEFSWSPNSEHFIYENEQGSLSLFNLKDDSNTTLTETNDDRLDNPQWSSDSSYLSVTVHGDDERKTAVLAIP